MGPGDGLSASRAAAAAAAASLLLLAAEAGEAQDGRLQVRWSAEPGLEELARDLAADDRLLSPFPGIGPLGDLFSDTLRVHLVREVSEHVREGSPLGRDWVAGFADPAGQRVVVEAKTARRGAAEMRRLVRHELAHLALHRAAGASAPRWLHEGYAQLVSGEWGTDRAWRLRFLFLRQGGGTLDRLRLGFPAGEQEARLAYLLSFTAVNEMYRMGGERGFARYFELLRTGSTPDQAMRRVYGLTLGQFEDQWRKTVSGRYGWLYLLTRAGLFWGVLSVAVLVLWWIRRRRKRRQLEEMREEEREEAIRELLEGRGRGPDPGLAPGEWYPEGDPDAWRGE